MKHLVIPSILSLAAFAVPATAQRQGMSNTNAPTISQSVEFPASHAKITVNYQSITWAGGKFMKGLTDPERGEQARQRLAKAAEQAPLGAFTTSGPVSIAGHAVAAGNYKLSFRLDDKSKWHLVLTPEAGEAVDCVLELAETPKQSTRLLVGVLPGKSDTEAEMHIAFGNMACILPLNTSGATDAKGEKPMKGDGMKEGKEGEMKKGDEPKKK